MGRRQRKNPVPHAISNWYALNRIGARSIAAGTSLGRLASTCEYSALSGTNGSEGEIQVSGGISLKGWLNATFKLPFACCSIRLSIDSQDGSTRHCGKSRAQAGINRSPIKVLAHTQCRVAADARTNMKLTAVASTKSSKLLIDASKRDKHKNPAALDPRMVTLLKLAKVRFLMGASILVHAVNGT